VDVDLGDADGPRGDDRALDEAVRIALEVVAVLERAGLALVDVDRHEARLGLGRDRPPLAPGGEARAAQAAQPRVLHRLDQVLALLLAGEAGRGERVAAFRAVGLVVDVAGRDDVDVRVRLVAALRVLQRLRLYERDDLLGRRVRHRVLPDD